ncbi:MAG: DUF6588 family protein [bacterium]
MKKSLVLLILAVVFCVPSFVQAQQADAKTIQLARVFSKDLFEYNGVAYARPLPIITNASTNAGFFSDAYVPAKVNKPYFKIKLNGMMGFVNDDLKSFTTKIPMKAYSPTDMLSYVKLSYEGGQLKYNITDTVGLFEYLLLNLIYDGVNSGSLDLPKTGATALGSKEVEYIYLPSDTMVSLFKRHALYSLLPEGARDTVAGLLKQFPTSFPMTSGSNISTLLLGVPQIEIGSLFGTELLLRLIPPLDLGKTFGKFSFWGVGLKHSISQYFNRGRRDRLFDMAIQGVYQGTNLQNTIGITGAQLTADASIYNINLHLSKELNDWFTVYSGISWESININMQYVYYLPVELQRQLGLLEAGKDYPTPGYPGDQEPSTVKMKLIEEQVKWTAGCKFDFNDFGICLDYSVSKFNILSLGMEYTFNK